MTNDAHMLPQGEAAEVASAGVCLDTRETMWSEVREACLSGKVLGVVFVSRRSGDGEKDKAGTQDGRSECGMIRKKEERETGGKCRYGISVGFS